MTEKNKWKQAADNLGLWYTGHFNRSLEGQIGSFKVKCSDEEKPGIKVEIDGLGAMPARLSLGLDSPMIRALLGQDIQVFDSDFDRRVRVKGHEVDAVALLDSETRQLVMVEIVNNKVELNKGCFKFKIKCIEEIPAAVRSVVELGKRLSTESDEAILERLCNNAENDPLDSVRLRNLLLLQETYPKTPFAISASRAALEAQSPNLQLAGALFLGEEGSVTLRRIAYSEDADQDLRVRALKHHYGTLPPAQQDVSELEALLSSSSLLVRRIAIELMGSLGHRPVLERIDMLLDDADVKTAEVIAIAIREIGDPAAEPTLLRMLGRDETRVKEAAANALGTVGTVRAVEPLLELTTGVARSGSLKRASREAISRIQHRLGDAEAGRLSLAAADDIGGELSMVEKAGKEGGLSFRSDESEGRTKDAEAKSNHQSKNSIE
ncbi:HEAT repeat domain-containing protein [Acidobacteriota bacterium]